jgi:hypothetical protein
MKKLKELALILKKYRQDHVRVLGNTNGTNSKVGKIERFYELLANEEVNTDLEAAKALGFKSEKTGNYRKLKSYLKRDMLNTLYFLDPKHFDERDNAFQDCFRNWTAIKILYLRQARNSAVALSKQVLKVALKHEFSDIVADISLYLREHYSTWEADLKQLNYYNDLYHEHMEIKLAKDTAFEYYGMVMFKIKTQAPNEEISETAADYHNKLKPLLNKFDNGTIHLYGWFILLIKYLIVNRYRETLNVCEEAIAFFEAKGKVNNIAIGAFLNQKVTCHIQLKQYEKGKEAIEKAKALTQKGNFNWFTRQIHGFMLAMHTGHYQDAYLIYRESTHNKHFKFMPSAIRENWALYGAYVHYLVSLGKIKPVAGEKEFSKFRLARFLNDVPEYSKDKRGLNVPILIIHFLFLIDQGKYDAAFERLETTEKYCSRYLKKDETFRSNCFIKMLIQMPISGFHRTATLRRAKKYREKLNEVPLDFANQAHEVEIIPYEDLWGFAVDSLDNKRHD